jgi:phage baseplate assembly protein W
LGNSCLRFEKNPITNDIGRKTNNEAIKQAIRNILFTKFFERPFNSTLGSGISNMLFEPLNPLSSVMIKKIVEQTISNFEPRVDLQSVSVTLVENDNAVQITVYYAIVGTQSLQTFTVILERTR